ncbi:MAG: fucose isomerase [Oscillospiraceae bacterium]|jgi:L-fucose mutarotase|nr:fucose isomerase [Oscillospiraceae bacterium]
MLKNLSPLLSPEMLKVLSEMGLGDEIVIADGNFPASATARRLVRADGAQVNAALDAVLSVFPLDANAEMPVALMGSGMLREEPPVWERLRYIVERHEGERKFQVLEREAFLERAKRAYAVIATGDKENYSSVILRKGLVTVESVRL